MIELRPYQEVARDWCLTNPRGGLFLDMGLGKTFTTLSALEWFGWPRTLVVAPKRVTEKVWPAEVAKFTPNARISLIAGTPGQRVKALQAKADLYCISRDNLSWLVDQGVSQAYGRQRSKFRFDAIVLDELSSFKTHDSSRTKAAKKLCIGANPEIVWGLTGTPMGNSMLSLFSEMLLIDKGETFGTSIVAFRQKYFELSNPFAPFPTWQLRPGAEQQIRDAIKPWTLSMTDDVLGDLLPENLPPIVVEVPFTDKELKGSRSYTRFNQEFVYGVTGWKRNERGASEAILADWAIPTTTASALRNKLLQYTAGFIYRDDGSMEQINTNKLDVVTELVESLDGQPVMVFYRFLEERDALLRRFPSAVPTEALDTPDGVDRWNRGEFPILVTHPASVGHGLNLQAGGHHQIWTTPPDSVELYQQGIKRLRRPGQQHPVSIFRLMTPGTWDVRAWDVVDGKVSLERALMDYLQS